MPLRILTQNLYNGRADPAGLRRTLDRYAPDVVAVQELSANAARVLQDWGDDGLLDPRNDTTGMGLVVRGSAGLSRLEFPVRWPIVAKLRGSEWDLACDLQVVNAHLMNPIVRPIAATRRLRTQELAGLKTFLSGATADEPRVAVGDLNSSPTWPLYRQLRRVATDAAVQAGTANRTWAPWPWFPRLLRIDHAFLAGPINASRTLTVRITGADHSGLLVDIDSVR